MSPSLCRGYPASMILLVKKITLGPAEPLLSLLRIQNGGSPVAVEKDGPHQSGKASKENAIVSLRANLMVKAFPLRNKSDDFPHPGLGESSFLKSLRQSRVDKAITNRRVRITQMVEKIINSRIIHFCSPPLPTAFAGDTPPLLGGDGQAHLRPGCEDRPDSCGRSHFLPDRNGSRQ